MAQNVGKNANEAHWTKYIEDFLWRIWSKSFCHPYLADHCNSGLPGGMGRMQFQTNEEASPRVYVSRSNFRGSVLKPEVDGS